MGKKKKKKKRVSRYDDDEDVQQRKGERVGLLRFLCQPNRGRQFSRIIIFMSSNQFFDVLEH